MMAAPVAISKRFVVAYFIAICTEVTVWLAMEGAVTWWLLPKQRFNDELGLAAFLIFDLPVFAAICGVLVGCYAVSAFVRTTKQKRAQVFLFGLLSTLASFVLSDRVFVWALVKYREWQHGPMKFTVWAEERALPMTLLICPIVFLCVTQRFETLADNTTMYERLHRLIVVAKLLLGSGLAAFAASFFGDGVRGIPLPDLGFVLLGSGIALLFLIDSFRPRASAGEKSH